MINKVTSQLESLKKLVKNMIKERDLLPEGSVWRPSDVWLEATEYLNFIFDLPTQQLANIRLHTGFITGVPWFKHAHQPYRFWNNDNEKETLPLVQKYKQFTQDIPEIYWTSEPVTNKTIESIGVKYKNRLITDDLIRYQMCITNLYNLGIFDDKYDDNYPMVICEIGGGYGGVAHQICNVVNRNILYVEVDLPEMLFWSAAFFIINNPSKKVYVYDPDNFSENFFEKEVYEYDIVFLPNYMTESLNKIKSINALINMLSFQEMSENQIREYAKITSEKLDGYIYSENFSRHWMNKELTKDVVEVLSDYFTLYPSVTVYDRQEFRENIWFLYTYIGTSKKKLRKISPIDNLLIGNSYNIPNLV